MRKNRFNKPLFHADERHGFSRVFSQYAKAYHHSKALGCRSGHSGAPLGGIYYYRGALCSSHGNLNILLSQSLHANPTRVRDTFYY